MAKRLPDGMSYIRIPTRRWTDEILTDLSDRGFRAYIMLTLYTKDQGTDGLVKKNAVKLCSIPPEAVEELVQVGLLSLEGDAHRLTDFGLYQTTTDEIAEMREVRAEAGRKGASVTNAKKTKTESPIEDAVPSDDRPAAPTIEPAAPMTTDDEAALRMLYDSWYERRPVDEKGRNIRERWETLLGHWAKRPSNITIEKLTECVDWRLAEFARDTSDEKHRWLGTFGNWIAKRGWMDVKPPPERDQTLTFGSWSSPTKSQEELLREVAHLY